MASVLHSPAADYLAFRAPDHAEHFPRPAPRKADILYTESLGHVGPILAAATGLLVAIGAGVRWFLTLMGGRQDRRIAELERRLDAAEQREREAIERERITNNRLNTLALHGMAVAAVSPPSAELSAWKEVIHRLFPVDSETPMSLLERALRVGA